MSIDYAKLSSNDLWMRSIQNDERAFRHLFNNEFELFNDSTKISDSIQELFVEMWENRKDRKSIDNLRYYLLASLRYKAMAQNRLSSNIVPLQNVPEVFDLPSQNVNQPDFRTKTLKKELSNLTSNQQEVLHLKFYQNLTNQEIARILDINVQSVSNLVYRGIEKMRKKLKNNSSQVSM